MSTPAQPQRQHGTSPTGYPAPGYGQPFTLHLDEDQPGYGRPPEAAQLAGWRRRAAGALIDQLLGAVVLTLIGLVSPELAHPAVGVVLALFGYLTGTTGQTPGRKAVGIKVVREQDGLLLGSSRGIWRGLAHYLDVLSLMLGYLWPLWDARKQTFADKIVGSIVIKV